MDIISQSLGFAGSDVAKVTKVDVIKKLQTLSEQQIKCE